MKSNSSKLCSQDQERYKKTNKKTSATNASLDMTNAKDTRETEFLAMNVYGGDFQQRNDKHLAVVTSRSGIIPEPTNRLSGSLCKVADVKVGQANLNQESSSPCVSDKPVGNSMANDTRPESDNLRFEKKHDEPISYEYTEAENEPEGIETNQLQEQKKSTFEVAREERRQVGLSQSISFPIYRSNEARIYTTTTTRDDVQEALAAFVRFSCPNFSENLERESLDNSASMSHIFGNDCASSLVGLNIASEIYEGLTETEIPQMSARLANEAITCTRTVILPVDQEASLSGSESSESDIHIKFINSDQELLKAMCPKPSISTLPPSNSPKALNNEFYYSIPPSFSSDEYDKLMELSNFTTVLNAQVDVFDKILRLLPGPDILACKLVSQQWYASISDSEEFWRKFQVIKRKAESPSWKEMLDSDLCGIYKCPNYRFDECSLGEADALEFFRGKGYGIKSLTLENCLMSLASLQTVLTSCRSVKTLYIIGLENFILEAEGIFLKPAHAHLHYVTSLTLDQPAEFNTRVSKLKGLHSDILKTVSLSKDILENLLRSCDQIKILKLIGWNSETCYKALKIIYFKLNGTVIKEIHFLDIPSKNLLFGHFYPLSALFTHIHLQKLSICFRKSFPADTNNFQANFVIQGILLAQQTSLVELQLNNWPISEDAFQDVCLPRLKKVWLQGTRIGRDSYEDIKIVIWRIFGPCTEIGSLPVDLDLESDMGESQDEENVTNIKYSGPDRSFQRRLQRTTQLSLIFVSFLCFGLFGLAWVTFFEEPYLIPFLLGIISIHFLVFVNIFNL